MRSGPASSAARRRVSTTRQALLTPSCFPRVQSCGIRLREEELGVRVRSCCTSAGKQAGANSGAGSEETPAQPLNSHRAPRARDGGGRREGF